MIHPCRSLGRYQQMTLVRLRPLVARWCPQVMYKAIACTARISFRQWTIAARWCSAGLRARGTGLTSTTSFFLADRYGSSDADANFELFFDIVPNGQIDVDDFLRFADDFGKTATQEHGTEELIATLGSGVSEFVDGDVASASGASYVYDVRAFDGDNETGVVAPFASNEDLAPMVGRR